MFITTIVIAVLATLTTVDAAPAVIKKRETITYSTSGTYVRLLRASPMIYTELISPVVATMDIIFRTTSRVELEPLSP